ncbi:hypothetical protein MASR1M32_10610 [Rhodobacter sp.]
MTTILQAEDPTAICRRALGLAEARSRNFSLEDSSSEAQEARLRYDQRRRTVLELLDWNFARRRRAGQSVGDADAFPAGMARHRHGPMSASASGASSCRAATAPSLTSPKR